MLKRLLRPVARPLVRQVRKALSRFRLRALSRQPEPSAQALARALRLLTSGEASNGENRIAQIERERRRLLACEEPLIDGSLGSGGLYDEGHTVADVCRVSKSPLAAQLLYLLLREFQPKNVIELGTNVGISSAYLASALKQDSGGKLITLEASPYRLQIARELHQTLDLEGIEYVKGLFTDTLTGVLEAAAPFDAAFIDGHHQYQPTLDYFESILQHATDEALFIFDDIRWSDGMWRAWRTIRAHDNVSLAVDLRGLGVCVARRTGTGEHVHVRRIDYDTLRWR